MMFKLLHILVKSLFIFLLLLFTLTIKTLPALADQTFGDLTINQNPFPAKQDSGSIIFTITANRDVFGTNGEKYSGGAWKDGQPKDACLIMKKTKTTSDPRKIDFSFTYNSTGCASETGKWHFVFWQGAGLIADIPSGAALISDYTYDMEQAQGGVVSIKPVRNPAVYGLAETPTVSLLNARNGNWYTFWWNGESWPGNLFDISKQYQATADGNVPSIDLVKNGADFNKPGVKRLCMEIGKYDRPIGVTCRYSYIYEFRSIIPPPPPPSGPAQCSIISVHGLNPVRDDSVDIKATDLIPPLYPLNQAFRADLVSGGSVTHLPAQNSDSLGSVQIKLSAHIAEGDYTANLYDSNDVLVPGCSLSFKVGPPGSAPQGTRASLCTDPTHCAFGGGKSCSQDPNDPNPGIQTAIGCIHTKPEVFVKDLLKFAVAISGGLSFLMMLFGAFQMLTSAGNPDTLNAGKERLTSAIIGLLFVIFSILLMQIIGVDILGIPGFTR